MRQNSDFAALFFFFFFRSGHFEGRMETLHQRKDDDQILKKKIRDARPSGLRVLFSTDPLLFSFTFSSAPHGPARETKKRQMLHR